MNGGEFVRDPMAAWFPVQFDDTEFERKHPRAADGKFGKKAATKELTPDEKQWRAANIALGRDPDYRPPQTELDTREKEFAESKKRQQANAEKNVKRFGERAAAQVKQFNPKTTKAEIAGATIQSKLSPGDGLLYSDERNYAVSLRKLDVGIGKYVPDTFHVVDFVEVDRDEDGKARQKKKRELWLKDEHMDAPEPFNSSPQELAERLAMNLSEHAADSGVTHEDEDGDEADGFSPEQLEDAEAAALKMVMQLKARQ